MELIIFDGLSLPNGEISDNFENIENIQMSEAGGDIGTVTRLEKLTIDDTIKCDGHLYEEIKQKGLIPSAMCTYKGRTFEARLRLESGALEKFSENIPGTEGLYTVALSIIEV